MYAYELNDLMFLIKTLKFPSTRFAISEYLQFVDHNTRAASTHKLSHHRIKSSSYHTSYFNRIIQLRMELNPCNRFNLILRYNKNTDYQLSLDKIR